MVVSGWGSLDVKQLFIVFPHIFVWGSCFWLCIPPRLRPASRAAVLVTHHLSHTTWLGHTSSFHTQLCHTPSFTHATLSHTIFHTPSFTYNFVTHHLPHTHNIVTHPLPHTHTHTLCGTGVALAHINLPFALQVWHLYDTGLDLVASLVAVRHFAWQAWHLATFTFVLCGSRRGTSGTGLDLVARLVAVSRPWHCGVWHLLTSTLVWRGRRGTWHPTFILHGAAALALFHVFAWQAWHFWHGSGGALGRR